MKTLPVRFRRTQYGAPAAGPDVLTLVAPVVARAWNTAPLPGVTATNALVAPAPSVSRIITPALVHALVLVSLTTRAVIVPLPLKGCDTNWNASTACQISAPPPFTTICEPPIENEPGMPVVPMSVPVQVCPEGSVASVVADAAAERAETIGVGVVLSKAET